MTKTTKTVNHSNVCNVKKPALKCGKIKQVGLTVIKKKFVLTKEQEAAIAETISFVIKSKIVPKILKKQQDEQNVPKKKQQPIDSISNKTKFTKKQNDATAKKTAQNSTQPKVNKSTNKKDVNIVHILDTAKIINQRNNKKQQQNVETKKVTVAKRVYKSPKKQDNKGEIKENKTEIKQDNKETLTNNKVKQTTVFENAEKSIKEKETKIDSADKLTAGKEMDNKNKQDIADKPSKDKKDAAVEKLIKEIRKFDCADNKFNKDKVNDVEKGRKQPKVTKVVKDKVVKVKNIKKPLVQKKIKKAKDIVKKQPVVVKVKKVNLKKLNKQSPIASGKKKKTNLAIIKDPDSKDKDPKDTKAKSNLKLKIKEEKLDEVLVESRILTNEKVVNDKILKEGRITEAKKVKPIKAKKVKIQKEIKAKIKTDLKKKLKVNLHTSTLKNKTLIVKKQNRKPKLVSKPIQQVKSRKLLNMWNGPKRHRVASLNAIAKVHCLYENESRIANFDHLDLIVKKEVPATDRKETSTQVKNERLTPSPQPTRTLRSVPGLRAVGKMWDMHDTTSSSEEEVSSEEEKPEPREKPKRSKTNPSPPRKSATQNKVKNKIPIAKRRKKDEIVMDLKDMVVRKRMASLNASAILAASYSVEKRVRNKTGDSDDSDTTDSDDFTDDEQSEEDEEMKRYSAEIKKEQKEEKDRKSVEVRGGPNKKVAVILNQDTDVTFTGVYVNSTTRSHHEGYCRIAGMQYRISATSHTQTAATAVATETILQSTTTTTHENENAESTPVKSYTPLDALSNMQPPANSTNSTLQSHHHLPPPAPPPHIGSQHVISSHGPASSDLSSLTRRHGCASAFSAPPSACGPQGHHHLPSEQQHGYVQGYYQPAGPLISVPHGHSQAPPPPTLSGKSVPLADPSPTSTSPLHQPPPPSSAGDSSDSEVIITSVTTAKEAIASQHPTAYRFNHHHYPTHNSYPTYGPYQPQYYTAPPPGPAYPHHDMCYTSFPPHKYMFRRYLPQPGPSYYQPGSPDIYGQPNATNQQVVTATSTASGSYQSSSTGPPPPTLMDPYPGPPPTLIETYPPPSHYYQGYAPAPPCYTHSPPASPLNYINATYQTCPCPMQSCPKNVHTGPLAGDSKRSNISIAKESLPLPPVALALPLEPASATGPPSPARGSAGMPPPPSPAGATYQPPPPKLETPEPATEHNNQIEKRRKARVGKAMVRNTIAQNQNTMLLMCQSPSQNTILDNVKREVESPKEDTEVKKQEMLVPEIVQHVSANSEMDKAVQKTEHENNIKCEKLESSEKLTEIDKEVQPPPSISPSTSPISQTPPVDDELLLPCQKTVAENVKVKNMKRKLSVSKESSKVEPPLNSPKKQKLEKPNGSYKDLIKKTQNVVKINNGRRKLITESIVNGVRLRLKKNNKRKLSNSTAASVAATMANKEDNGKRLKSAKPLTDSNVQNSKQNIKESKAILDPELIENKEPTRKELKKPQLQSPQVNNVIKTKKAVAPNNHQITIATTTTNDNNNKLSNIDRTIESVVTNVRANGVLRTEKEKAKCEKSESEVKKVSCNTKKSTNKAVKVKKTIDVGKAVARRRKSKEVPQVITRVPRRSVQLRWSNGWRWHGESFDGKVFLNSDEATVIRKCYPAMVHEEGDIIEPRDCVLLKAGQRKNELPFVAKIAALWENPDDGEMMMSLLWYYRPEHTEQGRRPVDQPDEVFASRHKDSNSVACIEDKCYVLTYNEYCRYRKDLRRLEAGIEDTGPCIPLPDPYPRHHRQPPSTLGTSADLVFFCRKVYDFRQKRIIKNPS